MQAYFKRTVLGITSNRNCGAGAPTIFSEATCGGEGTVLGTTRAANAARNTSCTDAPVIGSENSVKHTRF
jgi:hypothetical protein